MPGIRHEQGYSLIELIVVVIIIGILASVAVRSLGRITDTSRVEETKRELDKLACAIAGDPDLVSGGVRTDYGYVGDVGALPADLGSLFGNPGGWSTWSGPYIQDDFSSGSPDVIFKIDAWGKGYVYAGTNVISSTSGTATITRGISNTIDDLLYNTISLSVTDWDNSPPGAIYRDSVFFLLTYPNGLGSFTSQSKFPDAGGFLAFDSIPIGIHELRTIYLPDNDTILRKVNLAPGQDIYVEMQLNGNLW
jgi:prepilin-type N-terminal cleavage/methylation domain-containing protein